MAILKTKGGHIAETKEDLELTLNSFFAKLLDELDWDMDVA